MESHPVPKNVLTVEFKLFGPLTVSQFGKILGACAGALAIFVVTPARLRLFVLPIVIIVIGAGIMSALVKDFGVKMVGFMRAVFNSTQYVWRKQASVPTVLENEKAKVVSKNTQRQMKGGNEVFDDISIDRLLNARRTADAGTSAAAGAAAMQPRPVSSSDELGNDFFHTAYNEIYADSPQPVAQPQQRGVAGPVQSNEGLATASAGQKVQMGENMHAVTTPVQNAQPRNNLPPEAEVVDLMPEDVPSPGAGLDIAQKQERIHLLTEEINALRQQLKTKDVEVRRQVTKQIKDLFTELQELAGRHVADHQSVSGLFGVVVSKQDLAIEMAKIGLFPVHSATNAEGEIQPIVMASSSGDGRFRLNVEDLPKEEYIVKISHPDYNFPEFMIDLRKEKLPGFKFRAAN